MKTKKRKSIGLIVICCIISLVFLIPLYYIIVNAIRSIYSSPKILPTEIHFENFYYAVTLIPFFKYLKNTVIILLITVTMGVTLNFIYAYALARLNAKGQNLMFLITLGTMMIPGFAIQIPQYIFFNYMGLKNTFWLYVVTSLAGAPYAIFVYRQYLTAFPKEIEEAAIIDGCGYFSIITKVYLPMCKSVVAIVFFSMFVSTWGDYMTPFMFLSEDKYPLAIALFNAQYVLPESPQLKLTPVINASALLLMLPVIVVFFLCQRQLAEGVMAGSVKG